MRLFNVVLRRLNCFFQYGSDEFAHDSPRYASPTTGSNYYLGPDGAADWPTSYAPPYQTYDPYGLPPETDNQGLPPMSSFRANGAPPPTAAVPNSASFVAGPHSHPHSHPDAISKGLGTVSTDNVLISIRLIDFCQTSCRFIQ